VKVSRDPRRWAGRNPQTGVRSPGSAPSVGLPTGRFAGTTVRAITTDFRPGDDAPLAARTGFFGRADVRATVAGWLGA
jgi:hypothetical protein